MNDQKQNVQPPGLTVGDIYFILFRRKWIILSFLALAILAGVTVCIVKPPRYHSEAEFFIRYVVEVTTPKRPGEDSDTHALNEQEASILDTEMQIIRSLDVARLAADAVGPGRILAQLGGGTNRDQAAGTILNYLTIQPPLRGSVIQVSFEHPDPEIAQETLRQVLFAYVNKHKEMHQSVGIFGDFMTQETHRLRDQLDETEQQLKAARVKAGVVSLDEAKKTYAQQHARTRQDLFDAEAELAQHQAILGQVTNIVITSPETNNIQAEIPLDQLNDYKNLCSQIDLISRKELELLTQYTEDSTPVKEVRQQLEEKRQARRKLEESYPKLTSLNIPSQNSTSPTGGSLADPFTEAIQVRSLKSKIEVLNSQLQQLQAEAAKLTEMEDIIRDLERKKDLLEADLKYFSASLERSRVEEALGAGKAPNIGIIQSPTPPHKAWSKQFKKKILMLTGGCAAAGFALAFLIELFLDRSVKRASEVTNKLRLPLFISIPNLSQNGNHRPANVSGKEPLLLNSATDADADAGMELTVPLASFPAAPAGRGNPLRRYYEGLRDRLIVYFDVRNVTQKPKLVAVTSCGRGAGVTSIAAGLAASLSEIGDGNVLLVDMNGEQGGSQSFYRGKPACPLDDALATETMKSAMVQSNLYVATEGLENDKLPRALPGRFASLMPKLKASEYDYIIFDMPPVSQTSMTLRAARIMDTVLLVIEAEKTNQDVVKQAISLLAEAKVNVNTVLNKTRSYVPASLQPELSNDA